MILGKYTESTGVSLTCTADTVQICIFKHNTRVKSKHTSNTQERHTINTFK